jgi:hypothetical protein
MLPRRGPLPPTTLICQVWRAKATLFFGETQDETAKYTKYTKSNLNCLRLPAGVGWKRSEKLFVYFVVSTLPPDHPPACH